MAVDAGLRKIFRAHLPKAFWTSIETGGTAIGVPDSHYLFREGKSGWIEYKQTKTGAVKFRPGQIGWLERYHRNGGNAFVAVRHRRPKSARREACDDLHIYNAAQARALEKNGIMGDGVCPHHMFSGGPSYWNWKRIAFVLTWRGLI